MVYRGQVKNGRVVLHGHEAPPEGATVSVRVLKSRNGGRKPKAPKAHEWLRDIAGIVDDLPPDLSQNLDHYLYGTPKRT